MCGIFGYVGSQDAVKIIINGLRKLEYRGYDSAGIAGISDNELVSCKEVGKLNILEAEVQKQGLAFNLAIGHTRWATHGIPTKVNAHPQFDKERSLAVVHNGIIENHESLRQGLMKKGITFVSDTDTEVIAHLIAGYYEGDLLQAVQRTIPLLEGAYAIAVIHRAHPQQIIAVAHRSPLVVGVGKNEAFISSDSHAFAGEVNEIIFLSNAEIASITPNKLEVYNSSMEQIAKERKPHTLSNEEISKGDFAHYTLKEIYQQPQTIRSALSGRILEDFGTATFEESNFDPNELIAVERVLILACGTSWHAGLIGAMMLEDRARIPVQVEISSEFRYKNPLISPGTFVIAISQSGETADTIAAVREVKAKGAKVLAICNVSGSTLVRESDFSLFLRAGPEIGVCSTKAFTSQVTILALFTILMARMRHMDKREGQTFLNALQKLPTQVQEILDNASHIQSVAKAYAHYENFFFIGRRYMFPASLEGALKLKEISYINANGYAAGEMKHGPIALLNEQCPVVALCSNLTTVQKLESNLREVKARHAPLIIIADKNSEKSFEKLADGVIRIPKTIDELAAIPTVVAAQLLAYYIALEKGTDIDQPRNLAKSVTVE